MKNFFKFINVLLVLTVLPCCSQQDKSKSVRQSKEQEPLLLSDSISKTNVDTSIDSTPMEPYSMDDSNGSDQPSEKELHKLSDFISERFEELSSDNPLRQNVWGWGTAADHLDVYMLINTPYWQEKFRHDVYDSKHIHFDGPEKPEKIDLNVKTNLDSDSIFLISDAESFPCNSNKISFTLGNNNTKPLCFGVSFVVARPGPDGDWYEMPTEGMWNDMGFVLKKGGTHSFDVSMRPLLNNNKPGIYRLYKQVEFEGDKENFWIMSEFRLE